jgi:hypothetical protein
VALGPSRSPLVTYRHNHSDYLKSRSRFAASVTGGDRIGLAARRKWHQKWHQLPSIPSQRDSALRRPAWEAGSMIARREAP